MESCTIYIPLERQSYSLIIILVWHVSALSSREADEQGRKVVRGDTVGPVRDRRVRLPILVVRVHGSAADTVPADTARADLREHADLLHVRHNIPSDDTVEPLRDDRDGEGGTGVPYRPRSGSPRHGNWP